MDVSNPRSPNYAKYPSMQELVEMTAPKSESVAAVAAWLREESVDFTVKAHTFELDLSVDEASALFNTEFHAMTNSMTGQTATVGTAVHVPPHLADHIETVFGVHELPLPPRRAVKSANVASVTPAVITKTNNVSGVTPAGTTANRQAVAEFQGQLLSQDDLTTFFKQYVPKAAAGDDKVFKYVGDSQQGEGVEANLDIQYIMGVAPGIKTEAWQYSGQAFCSDLKQWTSQIISTTGPPNVFSVSYGWQGSMSQIGCSSSQISSIDADFKTITATGISIIFASGDSGSGYSSFFGMNPQLYASWPASSIWVTAVGATRFINQQQGDGEQASDQFGSGGGFSRIINPAPAFQKSAISTFYSEETNAPANKSTYGFGGRGTPDVAALGEGFEVIMNGSPEPVGGTSAAAPTFAALVSLANDARIQAGKKPLGCLNQWVYQQGNSIFRDVTVGSDRISRQGSSVPLGFDCEKGWDPVTGYGTVNFKAFLKSALAA
jgi:tripeptidyl-peptidase-1